MAFSFGEKGKENDIVEKRMGAKGEKDYLCGRIV